MTFSPQLFMRAGRSRRGHTDILFADYFNRSDSDSIGGAWTKVGDLDWGIASHQAKASVTSVTTVSGIVYVDVGSSNIKLSTELMLWPSTSRRGGCFLRGDGTTSNAWFIFLNNDGTQLRLTKVVSGSGTDVDTAAFTPDVGKMYKIDVIATSESNFSVLVDDEELLTASGDTALSTNTKVGLWASLSTGTVSLSDNFIVKSL